MPFVMSISLNVLNHLGINLYSNVPAVLSEVVANAWDADATRVEISIDSAKHEITIRDDGCGMTEDEINGRFLMVGFRRRDELDPRTPKYNRPVMGRKGLGKLSLFSIAHTIEVETFKVSNQCGFRMQLEDIKKAINDGNGKYEPLPIEVSQDIEHGTFIRLHNLKKKVYLLRQQR